MKKRLLLCMVMLNLFTAVLAQNAKVMTIADNLTMVSRYDNNGWGSTPKAWILQEQLNEVASNDDLAALARSHRNGAARAVAFRLLVARGDSRYRDILYSSLQDTTRFREQACDIIFHRDVANYMVDAVVDHWDFQSLSDSIRMDSVFRSEPTLMKKVPHLYDTFVKRPTVTDFRRIFTLEDSATLDSMLLFTPKMYHIHHLSSVVKSLPTEERYYNRLHQMFYDDDYADALPGLCRYRRNAEKAAVIECLLEYDERHGRTNEALEAVAIWPDSAFLPALREVRDYEVTRQLDYPRIRSIFLALMAYDDDVSYDIIDETLRLTGRDKATQYYYLKYFREAYETSHNSRYESLLKKYEDSLK